MVSNGRRGYANATLRRVTCDILFNFTPIMYHLLHNPDGLEIAEIIPHGGFVITSPQQFLDLSMNLPTERMIIREQNLDPSFFDLRSGLAGEILQKVVNYRLRLGIVGDFSKYESKALRDFISESNKGNTIVFVSTVDEAIKRLIS
jgi:hypothetical protein